MDALMQMEVELTLTVAELVDLIESGAIATKFTGYEPEVVGQLREQFTRLVGGLSEAVNEV